MTGTIGGRNGVWKWSKVITMVACVIAAGAVGAGVAVGNRPAPTQPPLVALVELELVINQLKEFEDRTEQIKTKITEADARLEVIKENVNALGQQVEAMGIGTPERSKKIEEFKEAALRAEFERQLAGKVIDQMRINMFRDLYLKVDSAAEAIAKKNGYDIVLVSDEKSEIPSGENEQAMRRAMLLKRMLYVNPTLDITNEVLQTMNNEWAAGPKLR